MTDAISRVEIKYFDNGVEKVISNYNAAAAAQDKLAAAAARGEVISQKSERAMISAAKAADSAARKNDELTRVLSDITRSEIALDRARSQGLSGLEGLERGILRQKERLVELTKAHNDNSTSLNFNRMQMMELSHVGRALFDEMAAGGNITRALAMESGRLGQILGEGNGGVAGTLKSVGALVGKLATGWVGLGVAATAAGAVGVGAALAWSNAQDRLSRSLEGTGRSSGMSTAQLNAVILEGARSGNVGLGEARNIGATFAGAGLSKGITGGLISQSRRFAEFTGQDIGDAGKQLAGGFADPAGKGVALLDSTFGMLSDSVVQTVKHLQAQGNLEGAREVLLGEFNASMKETADRAWSLGKAFDEAKHGAGTFLDHVGSFVAAPFDHSPQAELDRLEAQKTDMSGFRASLPAYLNTGVIAANKAIDDAEAPLKQQIEEEKKKQAEATKRATDAENSRRAGDIIRATVSDIGARDSINDQIEALKKLPAGSDDAAHALDNLTNKLAFMGTAVQRITQDSALAIIAINADTLAEHATVEAGKAWLAVMRESGDVLKANATAQASVNEAIAKANSDASDRLDMARQNASLVGLTPYQRGLQEIKNKYEGVGGYLSRDDMSKKDWSEAWRPVITELDRAVVALEALAGKGGAEASPFGGMPSKVGGSAVPSDLAPIFARASASSGVPIGILMAMARQESGFSNPSNGQGIMQILPSTARNPGYGMAGIDPSMRSDPLTNITFGANYLAAKARAVGVTDWSNPNSIARGLTAYNGGGDPNYAQHVMRFMPGVGDTAALTAPGFDRSAMGVDVGAYNKNQILAPFQGAQQSIADMARQTQLLTESFGKSKAEIAGLTAAEQLRTQYMHTFGDESKMTSEQIAQMNQNLERTRLDAQAQAQAKDNVEKSVSFADGVRGESTSLFSGLGRAIGNKQNVGEAFRQWGSQLGGKLIDVGASGLTENLFGKAGSPLGGIVGGLFGGGKGSVGSMNVTAGMVNVGGTGLGSILGGGGTNIFQDLTKLATPTASTGGLFSSIFGSIFGHNAAGTDNWSGGPTWVGEKGPELVNLPRGAQVVPNSKLGGSTHNISIGGATINVAGDVSEKNMTLIRQEVARGQAQTVSYIQRNLSTISRGSEQQA